MDHIFAFWSTKTGQISFCSKKRHDETNKTDLALHLHAPAKQFNLFNHVEKKKKQHVDIDSRLVSMRQQKQFNLFNHVVKEKTVR